jgi:hypothetical protein
MSLYRSKLVVVLDVPIIDPTYGYEADPRRLEFSTRVTISVWE